MKEPTVKQMALQDIKPYWRNPRDNRAAVEKVKSSIEKFGYNQLIAVDLNNVIVAGHTRFFALRALGWDKAKVMVLDLDEKQAKAYRIIDNKTNEWASWTDDLTIELRELDNIPLMQEFFTEDLQKMRSDSTAALEQEIVQASDVADAGAALEQGYKRKEKEVLCPGCGHRFFVA